MPSGNCGCVIVVLANWITSNQCLGAAGATRASGTGGTREIKLALHVSRTHDNHLHREIRSQMNGTPLSPERVACRFSSQYLAWREYDARPLRLHYRNYPAPFSMLFQRKREDVPRRIEPENGIPHVRILSAYGNQMTRVERLFGMPSLRGWCEAAGSSASCRPQNRLSDSTSHARPRIQIQIEPLWSCHEILQSQETTRSGAGGTRAPARKSAADTTGHITHRTIGTLEQVSHNSPPSKHENRTGKNQEPEEREAVLLLARFIDRIFFAHGFPAFAARSRVGSWMAPDSTNLR